MATIDLFSPLKIGSLQLPNRVVMAPMTRNRAGEGNAPTALNVEYYAQRAGAGLIVTEATQVSPQGVGYPGTPGIHSDQQVEGWQRVTAAVHQAGGRIFLQLWHVGRISHPSLQSGGALPVAPSAIAAKGEAITFTGMQPFPTPRALETTEIADVVRQFGDGARRALAAGFDGVELHGANGYLIDQFLRDGTNRRSDRYGGSIENRTRFLEEVIDAVVAVWGAERVGLRISPRGEFNDMRDSDPAVLFGRVATIAGRNGLAYLHVVEPVGTEDPLAPRLRAAFGGPLMLNGGFDRAAAEAALAAGNGDLVSFGAPFLANPDLPVRLRTGAPLNTPDRDTFYGGAAKGYTDYPVLGTAAA